MSTFAGGVKVDLVGEVETDFAGDTDAAGTLAVVDLLLLRPRLVLRTGEAGEDALEGALLLDDLMGADEALAGVLERLRLRQPPWLWGMQSLQRLA